MAAGGAVDRVIVLHTQRSADGELEQTLHNCGIPVRLAATVHDACAMAAATPRGAIAIELGVGDDVSVLAALAERMLARTRLIVIADPSALGPHIDTSPECVLIEHPDEATLREVLAGGAAVTPDMLVQELLGLTMFGGPLEDTLQQLALHLARAFAADDCVIVVPEEARCYLSREASDAVVDDLVRLSRTVVRYTTTVIAPARPGRPYRAFMGVPLAHDSAEPLALVLLCREQPRPFGGEALAYLRGLAGRLSADLSWRLVHERLQRDRDKLRELSRIDPVLGIANRTALQEELSRRLVDSARRSEALTVAVIDVDGLRLVNERNGYPAGDAVLSHVAQIARLEARQHDIVARYSGDAVGVVMPQANTEQATEILTRILGAIDATPVMHEDRPINLTVSAGLAELRHDGNDTGELALARAMAARDRARRHGEVIAIADSTAVADVAQPDFQIGTTLGGVYQIRHEISRGAFGVVYRAEDLALGRQVALKLLRPDLARDAPFVESFRSEAATLARIRHPNLVQVYAFGLDGPNVYFAMELVEGQGLDYRIHRADLRRRHFPLPEVLSIVAQIAAALEAVHVAGMVHRDVKPENVLVDRINRRCVLVDVGIAVRRGEKQRAGTPGFTAPEIFQGDAGTPASDVYSLGAIAYMLLTMQAPFAGPAPLETLRMQTNQRPRSLVDIRPDLPPIIDDILLPTLDPDPAKRPRSARALSSALHEALDRPTLRVRQTIERPIVVDVEQRPIVAYNPSMRAAPSAPSTRGVLFRSAYEALGAVRGSAWIAELSRKHPELASALGPEASLLAWHPTTSFVTVLKSLGNDEDERKVLAMQLGKTAADLSFREFYGADPSAATPAQVLRSVDLMWRCYHTWGGITVIASDSSAAVTIADGLATAVLCASTRGLLGGLVARAGGQEVNVEHPTCIADGEARCAYQVSWRPTAFAATAPTIDSRSS
jgi:serine/threonine-protein kinase